MKYIALLRGINVGGKNPVSMKGLKQCFEELGFENVKTYINSGNIIFDAPKAPLEELVNQCESAIEKQFGFKVICSVISAKTLHDVVAKAPKWWGLTNDDKHNAIFVIPPVSAEDVLKEVGEAKPEYEKVTTEGPIIFWTAPLKTFSRTRYSKIVSSSAYKSVTIRNANTAKKLVELSQEPSL